MGIYVVERLFNNFILGIFERLVNNNAREILATPSAVSDALCPPSHLDANSIAVAFSSLRHN
jgi:hypothetical protein